jgi:DNA-binding NarL/FixJ family response regulator
VIRLLIADDQDLMREGLRVMLSAQPDIEVVAEASDGRQAIEEAQLRRPDVALIDVRMPGMDGIEATRRMQQAARAPRVLILTTFDHDEHAYDALRAGATGFLLKTTPPDQLVASVRAAVEGESLLSPEIARRLAERFAHGPRPSPEGIPPELEALTARELDVLRLIARGQTNADIAEKLVMSAATVKTHVNRIFRKTGVSERAQAVVLAYESGFVTPGES